MNVRSLTRKIFLFCCALAMFGTINTNVWAQEVDKGKIPTDQLALSFKKLAWGSPVWDVDEALSALKKGKNIVWVDTRPESFFQKGTIRNACLLIYNKKGMAENTLTPESLEKAISAAGFTKDTTTVVFFCQGPKCHRSYNAAYTAVTDWGYNPDNIVWMRAGYPLLLKEIKENPKLKRKAKKYLSAEGMKHL